MGLLIKLSGSINFFHFLYKWVLTLLGYVVVLTQQDELKRNATQHKELGGMA